MVECGSKGSLRRRGRFAPAGGGRTLRCCAERLRDCLFSATGSLRSGRGGRTLRSGRRPRTCEERQRDCSFAAPGSLRSGRWWEAWPRRPAAAESDQIQRFDNTVDSRHNRAVFMIRRLQLRRHWIGGPTLLCDHGFYSAAPGSTLRPRHRQLHWRLHQRNTNETLTKHQPPSGPAALPSQSFAQSFAAATGKAWVADSGALQAH